MATKKKLLQAAAGQAGGGGLNVEDVFSTYLYDGNGSTQTITNGIDLDGEGGLVWLKNRDGAFDHHVYDTERGVTEKLIPNKTNAESTDTSGITAFNSNGFIIGAHPAVNTNGNSIASWTFRKDPKFFDIQTFSTTYNTVPSTLTHTLDSPLGMAIFKRLDGTGNWVVWHKDLGTRKYLRLNDTASQITDTTYGPTYDEASKTFTFYYPMSNVDDRLIVGNAETSNWVGYFFAHNDGDGEFGPDGDQDIIKCGTIDGNQTVDLGFEPQWVMIKRYDAAGNWYILDTMRGMPVGSDNANMYANRINAEAAGGEVVRILPNGLQSVVSANHIYIAIRRGTKVPESATEVFALQQDDAGDGNAPAFRSDFPVDAAFSKNAAAVSVNFFGSRLQGANYLRTSETNAEAANADFQWDYMNGWNSEPAQGSSVISYMWKRAPGYFDVVAYTGNSSNRNLSHNLAVEPEMVWFKSRSSAVDWIVYHKDLGGTYPSSRNYLYLNQNSGVVTPYQPFTAAPTASTMALSASSGTNSSSSTYIAYLFASLDGISKVGSYTGNSTGNASGITQTIDCGFTSGARFVLIKKTNGTGSWVVFDTERGIVSGNDPYLKLNETTAESTVTDAIDPHSSGFTLTSSTLFNSNGDSYIFYAIA